MSQECFSIDSLIGLRVEGNWLMFYSYLNILLYLVYINDGIKNQLKMVRRKGLFDEFLLTFLGVSDPSRIIL